jgi:phosphoribosyl 1,2-cyclic phosphodiesterase
MLLASPQLMRLRFWGVRGSIPTPGPGTVRYGGNTSCLEVRAGGQIVILDAGTGLRLLGRQLLQEFGEQPLELTLLLTHTHWDHIQGLPFFMPVYKPQNHLRILGYEGARNGLGGVLNNQMESPFFPINLNEVPANVRIEELKKTEFNLGAVQVQAFPAFHPGTCVGYRLSYANHSLAYFPDNELRHGPCDPTPVTERDRAATRKQIQQLASFLHGTNVLVMDTQYDRTEYKDHIGWGHGCVDEVVRLAIAAEVQQLYLFHHDPDHDDAKIARMVEDARQIGANDNSPLQVHAAREGLIVDVASGPQPGATEWLARFQAST